jgi:hypothetical protein
VKRISSQHVLNCTSLVIFKGRKSGLNGMITLSLTQIQTHFKEEGKENNSPSELSMCLLHRGVGEIHVNEIEATKCHLIMRVEKIGKIILNVCLKKPTSVLILDERKMQFQGSNFVGEEGADALPRVFMVVFSKPVDAKRAEEHIKRIVSE